MHGARRVFLALCALLAGLSVGRPCVAVILACSADTGVQMRAVPMALPVAIGIRLSVK
jgi:hypothetical protein